MLPNLRVAALLTLLLGCTVIWSGREPQLDAVVVAPPELPLETVPDSSSNAPDSLIETVLSRPLFEPARRPRSVQAMPAVTASFAVPRLTGTIIRGGHREAMLVSASAGRTILAQEGDDVEGLHILQISPGEIITDSAAGRSVLRISQDIAANAVTVSAAVTVKDPRVRSLTDQDE